MLMPVFAVELRDGDGMAGPGITSVGDWGIGEVAAGWEEGVDWVLDEEVEEVGYTSVVTIVVLAGW